jgi:hypothetical protein
VHFGEFALGTADVLLDELVQHFAEVLLGEVAVDDVVGVVLAAGLLEGGLGGLFEAEELEDVLLVGAQLFGHVAQVHDVRLDAVALALDLHLHLRHPVAVLRVVYRRRDVQHFQQLLFIAFLLSITSSSSTAADGISRVKLRGESEGVLRGGWQ